MRKAKIVCTLGPASSSEKDIRALIEAGMNVVRLNFSHGTHDEHDRIIKIVRMVSDELNEPVGILGDISGPKIRIGKIKDGSLQLKKGDLLAITCEDVVGEKGGMSGITQVSVNYRSLMKDVRSGDRILLDDGTLELKVKEVGTEVITEVQVGGLLKERKGINLPGVSLSAPAIGVKDREDIRFAADRGLDMIGLSFVRSFRDIVEARQLLSNLHSNLPVIAKIEKWEAVTDFERILREAEGIMIARGDLGVEMPPEQVPLIQKQIIASCNRIGKPVITATQMLESMIHNPRPTRAETSDVANAVMDGSDAVMLSGETAVGSYPQQAVVMMGKVIDRVECEFPGIRSDFACRSDTVRPEVTTADAVSHAATQAAEDLGAVLIVAFTMSGSTARLISKHRPRVPILAITKSAEVQRRLSIDWGVKAIVMTEDVDVEGMMKTVDAKTKELGLASKGDIVIITAGLPMHEMGITNLLKVHEIK